MSDVTTRVKLLGFVSTTGEPLRSSNRSALDLINTTGLTGLTGLADSTVSTENPAIEYNVDSIRERLLSVYDKSTSKYLNDQLTVMESVVGNLK